MIELELVSPKKVWMHERVDEVMLPGTEGDFSVQPNHAPLLVFLRAGPLIVDDEGVLGYFVVDRGICSVASNRVVVLVEQVADLDDLEEKDVQEQMSEKTRKLEEADEDEREDLREEIRWLSAIETTFAYRKEKI